MVFGIWSTNENRYSIRQIMSCSSIAITREKKNIYIYIEHRAGKAAGLASWRKMTQPASFLMMVALEGVPDCLPEP
jgi:hypothetical protein